MPGVSCACVDAETGAALGVDAEGLLEVKAGQLGDDAGWIRTTDLARIDADGFLWILGRADQAIIRGGFKVRPDDVRAALERHPRVRAAAVVSRADPRLGRGAGRGGRAAPGCRRRHRRRTVDARGDVAGPLRAPDRDPHRRCACRARRRPRSTSSPSVHCSTHPRQGLVRESDS